MAWRRDARVAESSTSTGTGTLALAAAYDGSYKRFNARCTVGDKFSYTIVGSDGSWERGVGTYSAANTLTRTTVKQSSNADALVNFAATSLTIFMDAADRNDDLSEGNNDVSFRRAAAGQLGIYDTDVGTNLRDLTLRNLALSGTLTRAGTDVVRAYTPLMGTWSRGSAASATYSRSASSTTVTFSQALHTWTTGDWVYVDFTTGTAVDGWYAVTVTGASSWTVTTAASTSTSGNATVYPPIVFTVTSEATHGLSSGSVPFLSFGAIKGNTTQAANAPTVQTYTIKQASGATFQLDGGPGLTTQLAATAGRWMCHSSTRTFTWTKPTGLVALRVSVFGGGGQGFCPAASGNQVGGAFAGGYSFAIIPAASLSASHTVTVGAAGYNVAAGGGVGQSGSTSSFGALMSSPGGLGGGVTLSNPSVPTGGTLNLEGPATSDFALPAAGWGFFGGMGGKNGPQAGGGGTHSVYGFGTAGGSGVGDAASNISGGAGTPGLVLVEEIY